MKRWRKIVIVVVILLVGIQFIRPAPNLGSGPYAADITQTATVPPAVQQLLSTSCYDCHSNHTRYPWYATIQPMAWYLSHHVKEGKAELNFNEFGTYSKRRQASKLKAIGGSVKDGSMPLSSYTLIHRDAKLSGEDKQLLIAWAEKTRDSLQNMNH